MKFINRISLEREQGNILFSSFAAISGVGLISYAALPFLTESTMVSLELSEAATGLIYSLEFITAAIASIIIKCFYKSMVGGWTWTMICSKHFSPSSCCPF